MIKKSIIILNCLLWFVSCHHSDSNLKNEVASHDSTFIYKESRVKEAELIHGSWVSEDYLSNIENTKSIYINRNYNTPMLGFNLDVSNLATDSAVLKGYTEHEGGYDIPLTFNLKKNNFILDTHRLTRLNKSEKPFELSFRDSIMDMDFNNGLHPDHYRKVEDLNIELRKILFKGDYQLIHSDQSIKFHEDGSVEGFDKYKLYKIIFDFGEGIDYDAIVCFKHKEGNYSDGDIYKYVFSGDTLKLYRLNPNWETMRHSMELVPQVYIKK